MNEADGRGVAAVLTDIEGTTSSISFVKEVLFPYARERMEDFIARHGAEESVRRQLDAVREAVGVPLEDHLEDAEVARVLCGWIDEDRKATPLKALQGMIWQEGYEQGDYRAHVYDDAVARLRRWHADGVPLFVYSSGSVQAQRLFFAHTTAGDLTPLFSGYFDTTTGPKQAPESYHAIANATARAPGQILFLSDVVGELDAARAAGMATCLVDRTATLTASDPHPVVHTFDAIPCP
ncbi:MAG: acireductone synthase [Gammaproteobacteria bacterium]|nr:acireductone synthase [Gammaproteobacteria bacterium]